VWVRKWPGQEWALLVQTAELPSCHLRQGGGSPAVEAGRGHAAEAGPCDHAVMASEMAEMTEERREG